LKHHEEKDRPLLLLLSSGATNARECERERRADGRKRRPNERAADAARGMERERETEGVPRRRGQPERASRERRN